MIGLIVNSGFDTWARARDVGAVYLFGSTALGTAQPDSDVDVGLWLRKLPHDWEQQEILREEAVQRLSAVLHLPLDKLDVRLLNDAPITFKFRVINCRRCLWEADHGSRIEWDVRIAREYYDFVYFEDMHYAAMRRQLEEGRFGRRPSSNRSPAA